MMNQLQIDTTVVTHADSIQTRFQHFHDLHPEVYEQLVELALTAKRSGRERWSITNLWEILRWHMDIVGLPDQKEIYKLNDHYKSRYARLIMVNEPTLDGFFEIRELKAL